VFEGMMLGKPVIVARDTNMDTMIQSGGCGIIVQYGEERELEQSLELLAGDTDLRQRLGQNARKAYEMIYSWQRMRDRLTAFYARIFEGED
jgi:glycosyltransferase involved in cell wall biosynthesis